MNISKKEIVASVIVFALGLLNMENEGIGPAMLLLLSTFWIVRVGIAAPSLIRKGNDRRIANELISYKELFDKGILTEEEYVEKTKVLKTELLK